jgi:DNA-binding transcriptional ArsR family regulator
VPAAGYAGSILLVVTGVAGDLEGKDGPAPVGADRVLATLRVLGEHPEGIKLNDLARALNSPKSSVHRALAALRRADLVEQDGEGRYRMGYCFLEIERDDEDEVGLHLWLETTEYPCRLDTWLHLGAGQRRIRLQYRLVNTGAEDLPYLWKLHVAVALGTGSRVDLGADTMYVEDFGPTRTGLTAVSYTWPRWEGPDGELRDMRQVPPPSSGLAELQYATTMKAGWCAVTRPESAVGLGLIFDLAIFPSCWTFASYGGWQDLHVLVLEPCTGYPLSVAAGAGAGTHRMLAAGQILETDVTAVVIEEMREVSPS